MTIHPSIHLKEIKAESSLFLRKEMGIWVLILLCISLFFLSLPTQNPHRPTYIFVQTFPCDFICVNKSKNKPKWHTTHWAWNCRSAIVEKLGRNLKTKRGLRSGVHTSVMKDAEKTENIHWRQTTQRPGSYDPIKKNVWQQSHIKAINTPTPLHLHLLQENIPEKTAM